MTLSKFYNFNPQFSFNEQARSTAQILLKHSLQSIRKINSSHSAEIFNVNLNY